MVEEWKCEGGNIDRRERTREDEQCENAKRVNETVASSAGLSNLNVARERKGQQMVIV